MHSQFEGVEPAEDHSRKYLPVTSSPIFRRRQGREYKYDPVRKLYLNPESDKWVQNPVIRRKEVKSTKTIYFHPAVDAVLRAITQNTNKIESMQYVLKVIHAGHAREVLKVMSKGKLFNADDVFVWCPHELYLRLLGVDYLKDMGKLVENGILAERIVHNSEGTFRTYRLAINYMSGHTYQHVSCKTVDEKISNYCHFMANQHGPMVTKIGLHLATHFPTIDLNEKQFTAIWAVRYSNSYLPRNPKDPMSREEFEQIGRYPWRLIDDWNNSDFEEKAGKCKQDTFGQRVHHVFTMLPSEIRTRLLDNNGRRIEFMEFDLVNAQPTIFANLLVTKHQLRPEDHPFIQMVEENRIYEDLMDRLMITRDEAKIQMMKFMFGKPSLPAQCVFETLYGKPAEIAKAYKMQETDTDGHHIPVKDRYKYLPKLMQRAERMMFEEVWQQLLDKGYQFIPVHDAVFISGITDESCQQMNTMIHAALEKHLKIQFKIKEQRIDEAFNEGLHDNDFDYSGLQG